MNYALVGQLQTEKAIPVQHGCRVLDVSRSGFYAAQIRKQKAPVVCATSTHLNSLFEASGRCYGSRRLQVALNKQGIKIGRYRVRSLMRAQNLKPLWKRKFVNTTNSKHDLPVFDNVLSRQFTPAAPNQAWVADITYIRTLAGWLYLAVVLDLYSRKVVGWAMAPNMPAELVCTTLHMAICQRRPDPGLIIHSAEAANMPARNTGIY